MCILSQPSCLCFSTSVMLETAGTSLVCPFVPSSSFRHSRFVEFLTNLTEVCWRPFFPEEEAEELGLEIATYPDAAPTVTEEDEERPNAPSSRTQKERQKESAPLLNG